MQFNKQASGEIHNFFYEMTTGERFCLSYEPLKWDFITFKMKLFR